MSYAAFYDSFIQHPLLLWAAAFVGLLIAESRTGRLRSVRLYCVVLPVVSGLDAWLTSHHVLGVGTLNGAAASAVPLAFVLLGDFRYFFFIEGARSSGALAATIGGVARAGAWTLVVPLASQVGMSMSGSSDPRVLFLIYEVLFLCLVSGIAILYLPQRAAAPRWAGRVTRFVILYYGLWATADAVILTTGADVGFLLRVIPNVLYYGGLVPVIAWTAPRLAMGTDP